MKKISTTLNDVYIIESDVFGDYRGYFMETYSVKTFADIGITNTFVQDNQSYTQKKGTLRGLHYQCNPMSQAKLVRVTRGILFDVAVDLRKGSPSYLKWESFELSAENKHMLYIPKGFAHGFLTLTDDVEFCYKVDNLYSPLCDRSIRYNDPQIAVDWPQTSPILSQKDMKASLLSESDCDFIYQAL